MKSLTYCEYVTSDEIEKAFSGEWMIDKFRSFVNHFKEEVKDYDTVHVSPDVATILIATGDLKYDMESKDNFYAGTFDGKDIYIGLKRHGK